MPTFVISTNLRRDQIPKDFLTEASKVVASTLGKPESYVLVQVNPDQLMTFGGSNEPCASVTLGSIGAVGARENKKFAPKLSQFIEDKLGIKQDRFYIVISDIQAPYCVWSGNTFG